LLNLALHDALETSPALQNVNQFVGSLATRLRKKRYSRIIKKRCPTYSQTRWCHAYLLCLFFARNHSAIQAAGLEIPDIVIAYGVILEPLFALISEFEDRTMRFHMRERKLAKFFYRMTELEGKYQHIPFVHCHSELLRLCVFLRFARQDHDLSLVEDSLTMQSKVNKPEATIVVKTRDLFLDRVYEGILNDHEIARAAVVPDDMQPESEEDQEEEDQEDQDDQEDEPDDIEEVSLVFDPEDISDTLNSLRQEMEQVKTEDSQRGIFAIGSDLINDYGTRSDWPQEKIKAVIAQYGTWLSTSIFDRSLANAVDLPPSALWGSIGTSSMWNSLREYAEVVISLPASEAENERIFSIRKHIVGDRRGRSKNDPVTARVRTKMEQRGNDT
jgi:hypothetical protein